MRLLPWFAALGVTGGCSSYSVPAAAADNAGGGESHYPSGRIGIADGLYGALTESHHEEVTSSGRVPYHALNAGFMGPSFGVEGGLQFTPSWAALLRVNGATLLVSALLSSSALVEWSPTPHWSFSTGLGWECQGASLGDMWITSFTNGVVIPASLTYRFRDSVQQGHNWVGLDFAAGAYENSYVGRPAFTSHLGILFGHVWDL